jgi:hypothetical protein
VLPGSALGVSADRILFHSAWDTGRSGSGPYPPCLDTRAVRTFRIHCGPRAETRGWCMRRLRRPSAPITASGANRSRLIHCLTGSGLLPSGRLAGRYPETGWGDENNDGTSLPRSRLLARNRFRFAWQSILNECYQQLTSGLPVARERSGPRR